MTEGDRWELSHRTQFLADNPHAFSGGPYLTGPQAMGPLYNPPAPRSNLKWIGVDLDGTLALPVWTPENPTTGIGKPIEANIVKYLQVREQGFKTIIHTSRPWTDYEGIEYWLNYHDIPFDQIQCGKPLFALYVDDRGRHADAESWLP